MSCAPVLCSLSSYFDRASWSFVAFEELLRSRRTGGREQCCLHLWNGCRTGTATYKPWNHLSTLKTPWGQCWPWEGCRVDGIPSQPPTAAILGWAWATNVALVWKYWTFFGFQPLAINWLWPMRLETLWVNVDEWNHGARWLIFDKAERSLNIRWNSTMQGHGWRPCTSQQAKNKFRYILVGWSQLKFAWWIQSLFFHGLSFIIWSHAYPFMLGIFDLIARYSKHELYFSLFFILVGLLC